MKKTLAIIFAALLAVSSVVLTSCKNNENIPNNQLTNGNNTTHNNDITNNDVSDNKDNSSESEAKMSLNDAFSRLAEIEPKNELDEEILLTVEDVPVSGAAVRYAIITCRQYYGVTDNADEQTQTAIDDEIDDFYRLNSSVVKLAEKYNLGITEEEFEDNVASRISVFRNMYGDEYETIVNDYTYQTPYFMFENQLLNMYYDKLSDHFFGENSTLDEKKKIYDETLNQMKSEDYVRAKHILISFPEDIERDENGNIIESAKAQTLAKANEVLEKVNAGEDFDTLVQTYGEDPGMETYPGGYYFTKGTMVPEFEETSYALEIGETSGLVETTYGYHIIQKLPLDEPALYESDLYTNNAYTALREMLVEISDKYEIEYADNYETRVNEFIAAYKAQAEATEAE